jgi:predicted dehydrogenase
MSEGAPVAGPPPVRIGVVGCARILPAHLRGIAAIQQTGVDPIRITALCARRIDDAAMFARRGQGPAPRAPASTNARDPLGAPHRYVSDSQPEAPELFDDWRAMLDADVVDAVLVLAPVALHHQIAIDALSAGKHVLIEKPFAISVRAGQAIAAEADARGLVAGVAENLRYEPRTRALRWVLDQGLIGQPQLWLSAGIGGEWAPDRIVAHTPWRHRKLDAGGGAAIDTGVHLMHQIRYLIGAVDQVGALARTMEPARRDLTTGVVIADEVDDVYLAQLAFASGAIGSAIAGWSGHGERAGLEASPIIYGTAGCIKGDRVIADRGLLGAAGDLFASEASADVKQRYFPRGLQDAFGLELLDFVTAINDGSAMEASAAEGVSDLAMAYAVLESSVAGVPVRVQDVADGAIRRYQAAIDEHYGL